MTITRFAPLSDVVALQNRLNSIFHDFAQPQATEGEAVTASSFVPAVDVYEDSAKLQLIFEVPGIKPEDVDVRVENNVLTVKGERSVRNEQKEENFRRVERRFGSFARSFTLPQSVDTEKVSASSEYGVLMVELPKKAAAQPKQIRINVNTPQIEGASSVAPQEQKAA